MKSYLRITYQGKDFLLQSDSKHCATFLQACAVVRQGNEGNNLIEADVFN